jgi:hypothetical protein
LCLLTVQDIEVSVFGCRRKTKKMKQPKKAGEVGISLIFFIKWQPVYQA